MSKRSARLIDKPRAGRRREQLTTANRPWLKTTALWPGAIFVVALLIRLIYLHQIESIPLFYHLAGDARTSDE
jgi:hypothetical protein